MQGCSYCGNDWSECPCLEHAKAIVQGLLNGPTKHKSMWLKRFVKLKDRFSDAQWTELYEDELKRGGVTPAPKPSVRRPLLRDLDLRLPPRRRR